MEKQNNSEKSEVALREEAMLAFWREHNIFNKTVDTPAGDAPVGDFVFYDGPPFATGTPHYGHLLAGTIKDAIPRFWTMNGYRVKRRWGWDCHGLPLENIIEKRLGLATKRDIEEMGVKKFNEAAREAVLEYADDWKKTVPRMGRFVDMDNDYRTMDASYTESVWWVFNQLNEKGLVFEGFKSMHLCPRCGTTLSNFEVNLGYEDTKDIAVTVKMPLVDEPDTSILIWTTTPWTLPGNMAVAVNKDIEYVKVKVALEGKEEFVILAKERLTQLGETEYEIVEEMKGGDLAGKSYTTPFDTFASQDVKGKENAWKVYHADFVEVGEEGTGAVHIAPAYGDDDMQLGKDVGLPIEHHVDEDGRFKDFVKPWGGQLVKPKDDEASGVKHIDADVQILKALQENGRFFSKENIMHSYPHCWRCKTPLINYATTSWFVDVPKIKKKLLAQNDKVKWVPEHVGTNRFGKWLEGARDWSVSRQRYWGAPLPIWKNPKTGDYKVFGSLKDLQEYVPKSGNTYITMRHGESTKNTTKVVTDKPDANYPLTEKGIVDVKETAGDLKGKVDIIITSPVMRALDTAKLVAKEIGIPESEIIIDERIRETQHGVFEGKSLAEYQEAFPAGVKKFDTKPEGGESWNDLRTRFGKFMYGLEEQYKDKRILIVSHGDPLSMLHAVMAGLDKESIVATYDETYPRKGVAEEVSFTPMPHNENYELDFHRPYIDEIELVDTDGTKLERVPDVFDCWFESGSMPYGQYHYPFENLDVFNPKKKIGFPAQFIAEGLDQTRGWFYSLMVLGTALFGKSPYENVIVNGLVLAEDGKKMSKSLQNYPDPMELVGRVGADAMRFYLLSSPVVRGEDLSFVEKDVLEVQRKNIGRLHNVLAMYEMFADGTEARDDSKHILDRWIIARLNHVIHEVTEGYKTYELDKATRPIEGLIDDLSVWYLRRSRDRLKGADEEDKKLVLGTLRFVLIELSKVIAPVMPFYAEHLYQQVKGDDGAESVHLTQWPKGGKVKEDLLTDMDQVRDIVTAALQVRTKKNIKVRQPVASVSGPNIGEDMQQIILDELNAKKYIEAEEISIDTNITPELKQEGDVRELMRAIQDARKKAELVPQDQIVLTVNSAMKERIVGFEDEIMQVCGVSEITEGETTQEVTIDDVVYAFGVTKV